MHRVMLIDDDVPMLKVLQQMIEWDKLDLQIVSSTYSSVKALHLFRETLPDIVVTDIGLPQKNGIELAAEFRAIKPETRILFLTCHEDFHYAQQAVKLEADDYLLKDQLTAEQLEESLRKSVSRFKASSAGGAGEDDAYSSGMRKNALLQMILDGADPDKTRAYASRVGISWNYPWFMASLVYFRYSAYEPFYNRSNLPLIRYAVYNIAAEIAESYEGITPFIEQEQILILYNYRHNLAGNDQAYFQAYLEELQRQAFAYLKIVLHLAGVTDRLPLQRIGFVCQQIRQLRPEYYESGTLHLAPSMRLLEKVFYPSPQGFADAFRSELERAVPAKDAEGIRRALERLGLEAKGRKVEPAEFALELVQLLREAELLFARRKAGEDVCSYIGDARSLEDALALAHGRLERLAQDEAAADGSSSREPRLQVIQAFIDRNLSDNLTSIDVAQYLYLNPSYFSRYFKRLTGLNFTDYVHQYKMKIAANLMKNTNQTLETLAMSLGYSDRAYFSKVFKKYIGLTPSEFKSKYRLSERLKRLP